MLNVSLLHLKWKLSKIKEMTVKEILLKIIRVVSLIKQISLNCPLFMLISLLKLLSGRYLLLGGCLTISIRTLKQTFKQKNKNYIYATMQIR